MNGKLQNISACVFDAYGTLFDVNSAAQNARDALGERWQALAELWRAKQLQYTWLRSLGGRYADFWTVTGDALDFAMAAFGLDDAALRARLMEMYLSLRAFPEIAGTLQQLKSSGMKLAILSNGTPTMLTAATRSAGIGALLDFILSVEEVGVFKPHPSVYGLACERLEMAAGRICFISSNGWDAYSAKAFGFRALWCNRGGQVPERIPETPDAEIISLEEIPPIVLA